MKIDLKNISVSTAISILATIISLLIKYVPDAADAVKDFIANLNKSSWTDEEIAALVADVKDPEKYIAKEPSAEEKTEGA